MRLAIVDVGTNSVHLVVADVGPDGQIQTVAKQREQVELGAGGLDQGRIAPAAFDRGLAALESFRHVMDILGVETVHTAATSAVREAENGEDFCREVRKRTGIHLRVISGHDEARLIWLGARASIDFRAGDAVLVDLGGGSLELVLCDAERPRVEASLPLGHIRLSERFHRSDPIGRSELQDLRTHVRAQLETLPRALRTGAVLVGTSGAAKTLARMATLARGGTPPEHDNGLVISRDELEGLVRELSSRKASKLAEIPGMDPKRKRTLPTAAAILAETVAYLGADRMLTSDTGLREGLLQDWIGHHRPELALSATVADPRRRSILRMAERYGVDLNHAEHVARLALQLFDATSALHRRGPPERELLELAALVHDVGHHIDGEDHHRHGHYLVRNTPLAGFTEPEVGLIANLVRFHRGQRPKPAHPELAGLAPAEREVFTVLAGILRLANALDRSKEQLVASVEVAITAARIDVRALCREPAPIERWAAARRVDVLAAALEREVEVTLTALPTADVPSNFPPSPR